MVRLRLARVISTEGTVSNLGPCTVQSWASVFTGLPAGETFRASGPRGITPLTIGSDLREGEAPKGVPRLVADETVGAEHIAALWDRRSGDARDDENRVLAGFGEVIDLAHVNGHDVHAVQTTHLDFGLDAARHSARWGVGHEDVAILSAYIHGVWGQIDHLHTLMNEVIIHD